MSDTGMNYQIIEVHWEDHHDELDENGNHGWAKPTPEKDLKPLIVKTAGYLICETDEMLEVARGYSDEEEVHDPIDCPIRIIKKNIVFFRKFMEVI